MMQVEGRTEGVTSASPSAFTKAERKANNKRLQEEARARKAARKARHAAEQARFQEAARQRRQANRELYSSTRDPVAEAAARAFNAQKAAEVKAKFAPKEDQAKAKRNSNFDPQAPICGRCKFFEAPWNVMVNSFPVWLDGRCSEPANLFPLRGATGLCDRFVDRKTGEALDDAIDAARAALAQPTGEKP